MGRHTVLIFLLILSFLRSVKTNNAHEILTQIARRESRMGAQVLINAVVSMGRRNTQVKPNFY
jgi:hypothetical protein